ncbi:hypothetical protein LDENG_00139560 [Lucifuga dentata]|nr:hypothetical protein LDENG_00139560 [Lucifuga dentata]
MGQNEQPLPGFKDFQDRVWVSAEGSRHSACTNSDISDRSEHGGQRKQTRIRLANGAAAPQKENPETQEKAAHITFQALSKPFIQNDTFKAEKQGLFPDDHRQTSSTRRSTLIQITKDHSRIFPGFSRIKSLGYFGDDFSVFSSSDDELRHNGRREEPAGPTLRGKQRFRVLDSETFGWLTTLQSRTETRTERIPVKSRLTLDVFYTWSE